MFPFLLIFYPMHPLSPEHNTSNERPTEIPFYVVKPAPTRRPCGCSDERIVQSVEEPKIQGAGRKLRLRLHLTRGFLLLVTRDTSEPSTLTTRFFFGRFGISKYSRREFSPTTTDHVVYTAVNSVNRHHNNSRRRPFLLRRSPCGYYADTTSDAGVSIVAELSP